MLSTKAPIHRKQVGVQFGQAKVTFTVNKQSQSRKLDCISCSRWDSYTKRQKVVLACLGWVILLGRGFRPYGPQQVSSTKVRHKKNSVVLGEV